MLEELLKSLGGVAIDVVLDHIDDIRDYLSEEALKTENQLDDALVDVFVGGLEGLLRALK